MPISRSWYVIPKGEGYGGNRPWWPHLCGAIGYNANGAAISWVDVVIFRRYYYRLFEQQIPPYQVAVHSLDYERIGKEMSAATPENFKC